MICTWFPGIIHRNTAHLHLRLAMLYKRKKCIEQSFKTKLSFNMYVCVCVCNCKLELSQLLIIIVQYWCKYCATWKQCMIYQTWSWMTKWQNYNFVQLEPLAEQHCRTWMIIQNLTIVILLAWGIMIVH